MIEFSFEEFITENLGKILKPFAIVTLINKRNQLRDIMLVDPGADITLILKIEEISWNYSHLLKMK